MKTTILGIEVGRKVIWQFKNYIIENKKREERLGREDKWSVGYSYAYAEISLTEARKAGIITVEQENILKKFLMNLEFPKTMKAEEMMKRIADKLTENEEIEVAVSHSGNWQGANIYRITKDGYEWERHQWRTKGNIRRIYKEYCLPNVPKFLFWDINCID